MLNDLTDDVARTDTYHSKPIKGSRTFVCAVDGSEGGNQAFRLMMAMRKRLDHVCIFHTFSLEKESNLPPQFRKDELRSYYENELLHTFRLSATKFSFDWVDRKGHSASEILVDLLNEYKGIRNPMTPTRQTPDFFFCGYSGRKKSHLVQESNSFLVDPSLLGSTTDFASRNVHIPVVISKKPIRSCEESRCFVVGIDGTSLSKTGFHILLQLVNPHDRIQCVHISPSTEIEMTLSDSVIFEDYQQELSQILPDVVCEFETWACPIDTTVPQSICDYALKKDADFISISPRAKSGLSSISEQIIYLAPCSIILTKN